MDIRGLEIECATCKTNYSTIQRGKAIIDGEERNIIIKKTQRDNIQSFTREVEGLTFHKQPGIVSILGKNSKTKEIYLEEAPGKPYNKFLQEVGRMELSQSIEIFRNMTKPLAFVHSSSTEKPAFVHYDISDSQFIIDDTNNITLLDFGTSYKTTDIPSEFFKYVVGTKCFLSPEKIMKDPTKGQASDVYGLGVLMYETLMGMEPFHECLGNIEKQILKYSPAPLNSGDKRLDNMVMSCLEKKAENRPTMHELNTFFNEEI